MYIQEREDLENDDEDDFAYAKNAFQRKFDVKLNFGLLTKIGNENIHNSL